jgi:hypothetical protein
MVRWSAGHSYAGRNPDVVRVTAHAAIMSLLFNSNDVRLGTVAAAILAYNLKCVLKHQNYKIYAILIRKSL